MIRQNEKIPLYEQVLKSLKEQIISGVYKEGELLPSEKELIENFGVSRITIRKTLSILAKLGLIETNKGKGSVVLFSPENIKENDEFLKAVEEFYHNFMASTQVRLLLEPEVARQAALIASREQIERMEECVNGYQGVEEREEFHRLVMGVLDNKEINRIMGELFRLEGSGDLPGVILPEKMNRVEEEMNRQHMKILEAIKRQDGEFAYFYMKEHVAYISEIYEEYFELLMN